MTTENSSSKVVVVAQVISLVLTFVLVFLGTMYAHNSWIVSFISAALSDFLVFVLIDHFIKQKQILNRKGYSNRTYLFLVSYAILVLPTSLYTIHALNVEFFEKRVAIDNSMKKIKYLQDLEAFYTLEYKRFIQDNDSKITLLIADAKKNQAVGKNNELSKILAELQAPPLKLSPQAIDRMMKISDAAQTAVVVRRISGETDTLFSQAKSRIQDNFSQSLVETGKSVQKWNRFTVLNTMEKLDNRILEERDSLNAELMKSSSGFSNIDSFKRIKFQDDLVNHPLDLLLAKQSPIIFVFVILFQCLLILPYWLTRKPKYRSVNRADDGSGGIIVDI